MLCISHFVLVALPVGIFSFIFAIFNSIFIIIIFVFRLCSHAWHSTWDKKEIHIWRNQQLESYTWICFEFFLFPRPFEIRNNNRLLKTMIFISLIVIEDEFDLRIALIWKHLIDHQILYVPCPYHSVYFFLLQTDRSVTLANTKMTQKTVQNDFRIEIQSRRFIYFSITFRDTLSRRIELFLFYWWQFMRLHPVFRRSWKIFNH